MFEHLVDPHPPTVGAAQREAVERRVRRIRRRRRLVAALAVGTPLMLFAATALAFVAGPDRQATVAATDDTTTTSAVPEETTTTTTTVPPETTTTTTTVATTSTTTPPRTMPAASCRSLPPEHAPPSHIDVWVTMEKARFAPGESVVFTLHARNRSDKDETYEYTHGAIHALVWVTSADAKLLWRSDLYTVGFTGAYPAVMEETTVPAGGEISERRTWRQSYCTDEGESDPVRLPSGRYTARGYWAEGEWWSAPVDFEIG